MSVTRFGRPGTIERMFEAALAPAPWAQLDGYPDDPSGLADEQVESGFAGLQCLSEAVEAKRLRWLAELERRASFRRDGYLSASAWLSERFGVAAGAAKAQLKVATALREMPEVAQAFLHGEVTGSAVRV